MTIWHNHRLKDDNTPIFPFSDRVRLGDGVFDTMLAVGGELVHAPLHFQRILRHADVMGMDISYAVEDLIIAAKTLLAESHLESKRVAINTLITRGSSERGLLPPDLPEPQFAMRASVVPDHLPPIQAVIAQGVRRNEGSPLSQIKSINYGDNILALIEANEKGANEAIMLNNEGKVTCASTGNVFIIHGDKIYTPPLEDGVLDGVTRGLLMQAYDVIEKSLSEEDLKDAQALYITNSIRGAVKVETLEGKQYPDSDSHIDKDFHLT